jgi:hypothetical protein
MADPSSRNERLSSELDLGWKFEIVRLSELREEVGVLLAVFRYPLKRLDY